MPLRRRAAPRAAAAAARVAHACSNEFGVAVRDIAATSGVSTPLFSSATGSPAVMPGVAAVTMDFIFLGRTWRLVISPSESLAASTSASLVARSLALGAPLTCCAALCSVLLAIFVRRNQREAREGRSFEAYVRAAGARAAAAVAPVP